MVEWLRILQINLIVKHSENAFHGKIVATIGENKAEETIKSSTASFSEMKGVRRNVKEARA